MAVGFSNTNKPLNPRGNDASPKGYNRAALYSGKALDFDGVNDYVDIGQNLGFLNTGDFTLLANAKFDVLSGDEPIMGQGLAGSGAAILALINAVGKLRFAFYGDDLDWDEDIQTGKWYSLAFTFNRTTKARAIYVNGQLAVSDVTTLTPSATSNNFVIGKVPYSATYADAQITGVKAFSTALTAAQVADLYNNPEKVVPTGVSDSALKLWLPMQEGAGTTCINGAPDAIGSEMLTNGDFSDGSNDWTFGSAFSVVNGKAYYNDSASGNQIYQSNLTFDTSKNYLLTFDISDATDAVLWVGNSAGTNAYTIISNYNTYNNGHYYLLLRGSDIGASETTLAFWANPSGAAFSIDNISLKEVANCGTISGATWTHGIGAPVAQTSVIDWNKRKLEGEGTTNEYLIPQGLTSGRDLLGNLFENVRKQGALNLDGNSWAEVHDNASLDMITNITAEAWVYWRQTTGSTDSGILSRWASATGRQFLIYHQDDTNVKFYTGTAPSTYTLMTEGWHHIVGTYDGANRKLYVDGVLRDTDAYSAAMDSSDEPVEIGRYFHGAAFTTDDTIAQPRIYNRALTASEVLNNYNATSSLYI